MTTCRIFNPRPTCPKKSVSTKMSSMLVAAKLTAPVAIAFSSQFMPPTIAWVSTPVWATILAPQQPRIKGRTGVPTTRPIVSVDTSQRLRHTINFTDETTPNSRAKPAGAMGCEIWVKVGDPAPTDPAQLRFLATDTRTPYVAQYNGEDAGKVAHYMLRWVNTKGEQGPWSQTVSATITG
jgi:hypothetical protein